MTNRITKAHLENSLACLNDALGMDQEPYAKERDSRGGLVANAGTFVLDWSYGGVCVGRMSKGGGQSTVSTRGTIRDAHTYISAMLNGIRYAKESRHADS